MSEALTTPALVFESVTKIYQGTAEPVTIFQDFSWEVPQGVSLSVVGESGTGKSTLLHLAAALDRPNGGIIRVGNLEVGSLREKDLADFRAKTVGMIFQFHFLLKEFSAWENVYLPGWMAGLSRNHARERASYLLDCVGLSARRDHFPGQLSGGERQRVSLARALINDPLLILADEPTGNLDEKNSLVVQELLLRLVSQEKKTLLLVTHDLGFASRTDTRWRLSQGKLHQEDRLHREEV